MQSISTKSKGERIKADIKGPPHKAGAPPPCRPFLPAQPTKKPAQQKQNPMLSLAEGLFYNILGLYE